MKYSIYIKMIKFEYDKDEMIKLLNDIGLKVLSLAHITWDSKTCLSIDVQVLKNFEFIELSIEDQIDYIEYKLLCNGALTICDIKVQETRLKA